MIRAFAIPQTLVLTLAASVLAATANRLHAKEIWWDGATGSFTEGSNWMEDVTPGPADTAIIDNGGTALISGDDLIDVDQFRLDNGNITQTGGIVTATDIPVEPGDNTLRGFNIGAASGGVSVYNASGTAQLTGTAVRIGILGGEGTVSLSDGATYTSFDGYDTWIGQGAGSVGTLNLSGQALWDIRGNALVVGRQGGTGTLNMSGDSRLTGNANQIYFGHNGGTTSTVTMTDNAEIEWLNGTVGIGRDGAVGNMTMSGKSKLTVQGAGELWVGNGGGGNGTLNLKDEASVVVNNWIDIGRGSGTGQLDISGSASITKNGGGEFSVGDQNNSTGTVIVRENGTIDVTSGRFYVANGENAKGTLTVRDNATLKLAGQFLVGNGKGAVGTVNLESGSITVNDWVAIGRDGPGTGILNISGGTLTKNGNGNFIMNGGANSLINQTGGAIIVNAGETWLSEFGDRVSNWQASGGTANLGAATVIGRDGTGTMTISGTANYTNAFVTLGQNGSGVGTLNLNGGTFAAKGITRGAGHGTLNLNGGIVKATEDSDNYFGTFDDADIHVQAGGLKFDTQSHVVTIMHALGGAGGLTKLGDGTLEIMNATTFTGASSVLAGQLLVSGSLEGAASLSLATGAALSLGNNVSLNDAIVLSLAAGSAVELNFSGAETIGLLNVNGVWVDVGTYTVDELNILAGAEIFSGLDDTTALTVTTAVPEPSTIALLVLSGCSIGLLARRRRF